MSQVVDALEEARAAAARQSWRAAYGAYTEAGDGGLTASDLENYGEAAWWSGKLDEAIALRERAYAAYTAAGDKLGAARMALTLNWDHEARGSFAVADGWIGERRTAARGLPEAREHARLLLIKALTRDVRPGRLHARHRVTSTRRTSSQRRVGDRDVEMLALSGKGRALIKRGEVDAGLALLDESTASAVCGDLRPTRPGSSTASRSAPARISATTAGRPSGRRTPTAGATSSTSRGFPGACRIHRAEVMRLRGDWSAAEAQAQAACEELHDFDRSLTAFGHYEIGEIRRRRGNFAGAEEAYARLERDGPRAPARARAAPARGRQGRRRRSPGSRERSQDAAGSALRLRRLPAQVEIAIAAGDLNTARSAADEVEQIVDSYKIGNRRAAAFDATVHLARGQIQLAEKDWPSAIASFRHARDEWQDVGAPYETAHVAGAPRHAPTRDRATSTPPPWSSRARSLRSSGSAQRPTRRVRRSCSAGSRLGERSSSPTSWTRRSCSGRWATTSGSACSRATTSSCASGSPQAGGEVVKNTGDGFFASFEDPKAAIDAAVAIQRALDDEIVAPDVRIGAHSGGAFRTGADSSDYGGQGVHVAARIGARRDGGRDPRQPRDARRRRHGVPLSRAAQRDAQGLRRARRRRLGRLALS